MTAINNKYVSKVTSDNYKGLYKSKKLLQYIPSVFGGSNECLRRFDVDFSIHDHGRHSHGVKKIGYASKVEKIICIDNVPESLMIYNKSGQVVHSLKLSKKKHLPDTRMVSFCYSHKENRVGVTNNDYSLSFWDFSDNFKYEKSFHYSTESLQDQIYYIEFWSKWLTVDQSYKIWFFDIENHSKIETLPALHTENIIDVWEIPQYRLVAVSSLDKQLLFWNLDMKTLVRKIKVKSVSIHALAYLHDFQVLAAASFANTIQLWSFIDQDIISVGTLVGHSGQVTSIQSLVDTPLLISADELGMIKTWDVRTQKWVQSYLSESRTIFKNIINIGNEGFVCSEQRLTWFKFETTLSVNANGILIEGNFPNSIDYNYEKEEIIISTKSDIRWIDAKTGNIDRILSIGDTEITKWLLNFDQKSLIVCKSNGEIGLHSTFNGENLNNLIGHSNDVTSLWLDHENKLIVTSGCDSRLLIQQEKQNDNLIKLQERAHLKSEITLMWWNLNIIGR